jgi:hypothetical protein
MLAFDFRLVLLDAAGAITGEFSDASPVFSAATSSRAGFGRISTTLVFDAPASSYGGGGPLATPSSCSFFRILNISNATATMDNASAATPTPMPTFAPVLRPFDVSPKNGGAELVANGGRVPVPVRNGGSSVNE